MDSAVARVSASIAVPGDDRDASHGRAEAGGRVDQMVMPARGIIIDFVTAGRRNSLAGKRKLARIGRPRG